MQDKQEIFLINKRCLTRIPQMAELYRRQQFFHASWQLIDLISDLKRYAQIALDADMSLDEGGLDEFMQILKAILQAQEQQDNVLLADIIQGDLYYFMQQRQMELIGNGKEIQYPEFWQENLTVLEEKQPELKQKLLETVETDQTFFVTPAINGQPTLRYLKDGLAQCMHSTIDPEEEARIYASQFEAEKIQRFYVYGIGLGYHIKALLDNSKLNQVIVLEKEIQILRKALRYQKLAGYLKEGRLRIVYEPNLNRLLKSIGQEKEKELLIHYPSLLYMENGEEKNLLENYFISSISVLEGKKLLFENFERLKQRNLPECGEIKDLFRNKNVVIVAGGPSLDTQIKALKKWKHQLTILSVGTAAKKLIGEGIQPSAIIISDPQEAMYRQIEGIDGRKIPLLMLSTSSANVAEYYQGKIYIVYQSGYDFAEKVAQEKGYQLFETGGSVTTLALDIALRYHAKQIILVGADFAYTNHQSHAGGLGRKIVSDSKLRIVESVDGTKVETSRNLDIYRRWVEERIRDVADIVVYNTAQGARIHGTRECGLDEIMRQIEDKK